jgi:membrane dipeptidase
MNRLGILIDITHATDAAQRQIIEASEAPVVASHVGLRAICNNPVNLPDDILRDIAVKGGLVGIHSTSAVISQRYFDYSRAHHPAAASANVLFEAVDAEPPLERTRDPDSAEYIDAVDGRLGTLWRQLFATPWHDDPTAEALVPTLDEWADHVAHAVEVAGPSHVGIGLDLFTARSTLKDFDARGYSALATVLKKRNVGVPVLGENWLRVLDGARVQ